MNRIKKAFENGPAFIGFLTGGDPDLDTTKKYNMRNGRSRCRFNRNRYSFL